MTPEIRAKISYISAIYRISKAIDMILAIESTLKKKSKKYRQYSRYFNDISENIDISSKYRVSSTSAHEGES